MTTNDDERRTQLIHDDLWAAASTEPSFDVTDLQPYLAVLDAYKAEVAEVTAPGMVHYYIAEAEQWAASQARTERDVLTWAGTALRSHQNMEWSDDEAREVALAYLRGWQRNPRSLTFGERMRIGMREMREGLGL